MQLRAGGEDRGRSVTLHCPTAPILVYTHTLPAHREQPSLAAWLPPGSQGSRAGHPASFRVFGCDQVGFFCKLCWNRLLFWLTKTMASRREDRLINQAGNRGNVTVSPTVVLSSRPPPWGHAQGQLGMEGS